MRQLKITKSITPRDEKSLEKYLTEIARYEVCSVKEEQDLFDRYQNQGDDLALQEIVNRNLRFVVSVAKQYTSCGMPLTDLINEGNMGLIVAAKRFDTSKGFKFISYAVWWIRQKMIMSINKNGKKIRAPYNIQTLINQIKKAQRGLEQSLERSPTYDELAADTGLKVAAISRAMIADRKCKSLDASIDAEDDRSLIDLFIDEDSPAPDSSLVEHESQQMEVKRLLKLLDPREAKILSLHFGVNGHDAQSLREIAYRTDLSMERVRQIRNKSIARLRRRARSSHMATMT